jgi:hypothetical protein
VQQNWSLRLLNLGLKVFPLLLKTGYVKGQLLFGCTFGGGANNHTGVFG